MAATFVRPRLIESDAIVAVLCRVRRSKKTFGGLQPLIDNFSVTAGYTENMSIFAFINTTYL